MSEHKFKIGDRIRMMFKGMYHYGGVAEVREDGYCKLLFDSDGPAITYYPESVIELVRREDE